MDQVPRISIPEPFDTELEAAATKIQAVYKSYRTRRNLADCAVVVEELWWKALNSEALNNSFEAAMSKLSRARTSAAKKKMDQVPRISIPEPFGTELEAAATKIQTVYKSYRTRRNLADCAVVVKEHWWKALDSEALNKSFKQEAAMSKLSRARTRAAKVGKALQDEKAQKTSSATLAGIGNTLLLSDSFMKS